MDEGLRDSFNVTGLAHILSISGTHFGLFSMLLFGMFSFLIKAFPYRSLQRITIFLTPSQAAAILCFPFKLSFLAVLFIGFSLGNNKDEKKEDKKIVRYIKNAVLLTLSASIGTAPLVAYHFHYFSIISPLSNLFIAPLIGFVLIPLSVFSSFLFLITGHYMFTPIVSAISDVSLLLVKIFSHIRNC